MERELKLCPFCGGKGMFRVYAAVDYGADGVIVQCRTCGARTDFCGVLEVTEAVAQGMQLAAESWNSRNHL